MNLRHTFIIGAVGFAILACTASVIHCQEAKRDFPRTGLADLKVVLPVSSCSELTGADIPIPADAKLHISEATEVNGGPAPYCNVTGYIASEVRFEVRLPLKTWTQRFVQTGCGGLCGNLQIVLSNDSTCAPAQNGELVLASTDMGHSGGMNADWAAGHPDRVIDFAYRGVHVTTVAAKAIATAFYQRAPRYSYFAGCSDGGREALMEAQRFPDDFDGITAGAAAMNFITQNTFYHGWNAIKNTDENGKSILTADQLPILHAAAVAACDASNGLKDGLISDPTKCYFDPAVVRCKAGESGAKCLSAAQVEVARDIYRGAHDARGQQLVISGPQYGSELAWAGVYIPRSKGDSTMSSKISLGTLQSLTSWKPNATFKLRDLQFTDAEFKKITALHALFDATDPDLSRFAGLKHKLIMWHGWSDPHISPLNSIAYYEAMQRTLGKEAVEQFARLYLVPGGYHCGGGDGPFNMDLLTPLMQWVESGIAPSKIVASHTAARSGLPSGPRAALPQTAPGRPPVGMRNRQNPPTGVPGLLPSTAELVDRTRPVYPYPQQAKYSGTGSIASEQNFRAAPGEELSEARLHWLGSRFYSTGYELWCTA